MPDMTHKITAANIETKGTRQVLTVTHEFELADEHDLGPTGSVKIDSAMKNALMGIVAVELHRDAVRNNEQFTHQTYRNLSDAFFKAMVDEIQRTLTKTKAKKIARETAINYMKEAFGVDLTVIKPTFRGNEEPH
jgi:acyl-CoA synthetase (NDP forming)